MNFPKESAGENKQKCCSWKQQLIRRKFTSVDKQARLGVGEADRHYRHSAAIIIPLSWINFSVRISLGRLWRRDFKILLFIVGAWPVPCPNTNRCTPHKSLSPSQIQIFYLTTVCFYCHPRRYLFSSLLLRVSQQYRVTTDTTELFFFISEHSSDAHVSISFSRRSFSFISFNSCYYSPNF